MREGTGENPGHRTGGGSERCWAGSLCYRYGRDKELVAKAAAESVYSGIGVRRGVAEAGWNLGQLRAVLAGIAGRCGGFRMKIVSRCREQARRAYHGAVFEIKKEIKRQKENVRIYFLESETQGHWRCPVCAFQGAAPLQAGRVDRGEVSLAYLEFAGLHTQHARGNIRL